MLQNILKLAVIGILCALLAMPAMAANAVYIAQTSAGGATGADCADAMAYTYFNSSGNWSATPTGIQIGPGTTVHICGTLTGAANSTVLTFQGSGGSGNVVTLLWETGAVVAAPYFAANAGVYLNGQSHILLNGGTNGIIKTTANGTSLTYQQATAGIYSGFSGSDIEIENLTVSPIYQIVGQDVPNESAWENTVCIDIDEGYDTVKVHNNNLSYCRIGIFNAYTTMTSGLFYNNTIDYSSWMLIVGDGANSSTATGVQIYGNQLGPHFQAFIPADQSVHADGIFVFATNTGSSFTGQIWNNYAHGDMCTGYGNCTAYLFVGSGVVNTPIFNNVFWADTGGPEADVVIRGGIQAENNIHFVNNTMGGGTAGLKTDAGGGGNQLPANLIVQNNIFAVTGIGIIAGPANFNMFSTVDYNDYYGNSDVAANQADTGPGNYFATLSAFQATTIAGSVHPEAHGNNVNPSFNVSAPPYWISNSTVGTGGVNLSGLGITPLDSDAPYTFGTGYACGAGCMSRTSWPMGPYQVGTTPPPVPSAPSPQMFVWNGSVTKSVSVPIKCSCSLLSSKPTDKLSCSCD